MTNCTTPSLSFSSLKRRKVEGHFSGGDITSDAGALLLREVDRRLELTQTLSEIIPDQRNPELITHSLASLLKQRIYGLALGYEDLNDHDTLRHDVALQTAVERDEVLASSSTLCRLENRQAKQVAFDMNALLVEKFIQSFESPPQELILDFDPTDDRVHGHQEQRFYHGYYKSYCFLPLYVFCGDHLLVSYLRPANIDGARHAWAILALLVRRLRQQWPDVRLIFRGDSACCRDRLLRWCERQQVGYLVGLPRNKRLLAQTETIRQQAEEAFNTSKEKQRLFTDFQYAANSWQVTRRVIIKAEHTDKGANPRFITTNLPGEPQTLYDPVYCARGDMENRIKQQQLDLFADRTSCHAWWANQFRLLLSSMAYVLIDTLRRIGLQGTKWARAYAGTIRLKFFKLGAVIIRNTRRIRFLMASAYPYQAFFSLVVQRLRSG